MIGYLCGQLMEKYDTSIILDVEGVGYLVHLPAKTLETLSIGDSYALHIYTAVSENDIRLYGFLERTENKLFRMFISIKGIGPKYALGLLNIPYKKLCAAISNGDTAILTTAPGIGKKAAERIVLELKNKVDPSFAIEHSAPKGSFIDEAILALTNLGYTRQQVQLALQELPETVKDSEAAIRHFLKQQ